MMATSKKNTSKQNMKQQEILGSSLYNSEKETDWNYLYAVNLINSYIHSGICLPVSLAVLGLFSHWGQFEKFENQNDPA